MIKNYYWTYWWWNWRLKVRNTKFFRLTFMLPNLACNEHWPERYSISVPAHQVNICRIATPPSFHLLERRYFILINSDNYTSITSSGQFCFIIIIHFWVHQNLSILALIRCLLTLALLWSRKVNEVFCEYSKLHKIAARVTGAPLMKSVKSSAQC